MQCACVVLHCHLWRVWLYDISPHYIINSTIIRGEMLLNIVCFDILYDFCLKQLIQGNIQPDIVTNVRTVGLHVKFPTFLSHFNET